MTKIKLPYSFYPMALIGVLLGLSSLGVLSTVWSVSELILAMAVIGGAIEFIGGTALMIKLQSSNKFEYESIYGKLLGQFTILRSVSVTEIQVLVGARLAACMILGFNLLWGNVFAVILFLLTTIHYVPNKKPRR